MRNVIIVILIIFPITLRAQWEPDVRLTYNDSVSYTCLNNTWCITANGDTVHVVWSDRRDGNLEIYYKRSINSGTDWEQDTRLTNNSASSGNASVAVAGSYVHCVWLDDRDGNSEVYYKRSTNGGGSWGPDTRLTNNSVATYCPSLAVSGSNVHMVCQERWEAHQIYYKRSTNNGTTWGPTTRISYIYAFADGPSIAVTGTNLHVAFWDARSGGFGRINYKRSTNNGANWTEDSAITHDRIGAELPSIAVNASNIHLTWNSYRGTALRNIYYKRSTNGGVNWEDEYSLTNYSATSCAPSIAVSGLNVHIVWQSNRDGDYEIYYRQSVDGGITWLPEIRLTNSLGNSLYPSIAVSGSTVHVVWCDNRDGNYEIYYKRNPTANVSVADNQQMLSADNLLLEVFPNPARNYFTIRFSPTFNQVQSVIGLRIFDITGKLIREEKFKRSKDKKVHKVSLENIKSGVYFVKMGDDNITKKLIVAK
ncbi:MAG: T9SS type A sorting domain-containing protein [candidate division WOR-3 bacterium]|nr:T9SS type A sorting domain-containing protein [candidate division WOR-3 bacterium]